MLGLTLAEIMLFLLFALLLLLGAQADRTKSQEEKYASIAKFFGDQGSQSEDGQALVGPLTDLLEATTINRRDGESIEDTWTRIGNYLNSDLLGEAEELQDMLIQLRQEVADKETEVEGLEHTNTELKTYSDGLVAQLDITRGGATPPCLYNPPSAEFPGVRGRSVPIALILIEDGQLTFLDTYMEALSGPLVDFWGRSVDTSDLEVLLSDIQTMVPLDFGGFGSKATPIKQLGDVENENHSKCLFTADYVMDDFVPLRMFTQVFQSYFLPQTRRTMAAE